MALTSVRWGLPNEHLNQRMRTGKAGYVLTAGRPRISKLHAACQNVTYHVSHSLLAACRAFDRIRTITTVRKLPISHLLFYDSS